MRLLRSKIRPPELPRGTIDRPRLLDRILEQDRGLVLLQAPAGYGKTVLAVQVSLEDPKGTAWLYLEPEDTDPRRFCRYLLGALAEIVPGILDTELPRETSSPEFDSITWTEDLALYLQEVSRRRLRLILDNFEAVAASAGLVQLVERILARTEGRLDLLLTSRVPPGMRLGRRQARGDALVLEADDLAMSLEEFREASEALGGRRQQEEVEERWSRSEGWCVVLALGEVSPGKGGDYLEEEVLSAISPDLAELLEASSLLSVIEDSGLAALGRSDMSVQKLAEVLTEAGVPHFRVGDAEGIRLHPLVRERLFVSYRSRKGTAARSILEWYLAENRVEEAIRLLIELEDHESLLQTLVRVWPALEEQELVPQVDGWLRILPPSLERHPLFLATRCRYLRFNGENRELAVHAGRLLDSGDLGPEHPLTREIWAADVWARTHLAMGPGYESHRRRWETMEKRADPGSRLQAEYALAVTALYELRFPEALTHAAKLQDLARDSSIGRQAAAANAKAVVHHEIGESDEALRIFESQIALCRKHDEVSSLTINLIGKANLMKDVGRFQDAIRLADEAIDIARRAGASRLVLLPHAARIRGEATWHLGQPGRAMAELEQAYSVFQDHNRYESLATGVLIDHWKSVSGGKSNLVTERDFRDTARISEAHVRFLIRRGRELGGEGRHQEALAALEQARDLGRDMPFWMTGARFTEAWVRSREGREEESNRVLGEGLQLLETMDRSVYALADPVLNGWIAAGAVALDRSVDRALEMATGERAVDLSLPFRERLEHAGPEETRRLVETAIRLGVRGLEETVDALPDVPEKEILEYRRVASRAALPPLKFRVLGAFEGNVQGRAVQFPRRASRSVLEILLLEHPRPVHEERLLEFIWPDADPEKAKRSLQTAVNDLRRALDPHHRPRGSSYVPYGEESYSLELPPGSFVDLHEFRKSMEAVLSGNDPAPTRVARLREVLSLYRGDLLADAAYAEHAGEPREQMRSLMLEGVAALAQALENEEGDEARAVLKRGLEADPYWGEGVGLLMDHLERRGRVLAAIRVYRDYERRLREDLGLEPDPPLTRKLDKLTSR